MAMILALILVIIIKTISFRSLQIDVEPITPPLVRMESIKNLSKAITFPTVSVDIGLPIDTPVFQGFHQFLTETYPLIHTVLQKEVFSEFSILYRWEGKNPQLKPVILLAHMDVVPDGGSDTWEKPPFSGDNDGTFIWGRGTLDDKGQLIAILEAVEQLIGENFVPERTIYLAFGHDEEIAGLNGARLIAETLRERGVEAEFVLDEGLVISKGIVPMINIPVASVGISEKGYLSMSLTVEMDGGHSSYPEKETAITLLNKALDRIVHKPMKAGINGPVKDFIRYTGPEMPLIPRAIFANTWLFEKVILNIYEGSSTGNASVRTTAVPTIIQAGVKHNMVPIRAEAVVNFRISPGETADDIIKHIEKVVSDDRVKNSILPGNQEPSPVSSVNSEGFKIIHTTIKQLYPEVLVTPMLTLGQTDSRHFAEVSSNIFRFLPVTLTQDDLTRIHGINERINIEDFKRSVGFYHQLIKNLRFP